MRLNLLLAGRPHSDAPVTTPSRSVIEFPPPQISFGPPLSPLWLSPSHRPPLLLPLISGDVALNCGAS